MKKAVALGTLLLIVALWGLDAAAASEISTEELAILAGEAVDDPAARSDLADVTSVDGVPFDAERILRGSETAVRIRLETLSSAAPADAASGDEARTRAAEILARPEYGQGEQSGPTILERLARLIPESVRDALISWPGVIIAALLVLTIVLLTTRNAQRRRLREESVAGGRRARSVSVDYAAAAADARRRGDYSEEVRLRFRAGMHTLGELGLVTTEQTVTAGSLRRLLGNEPTNAIVATFERVAYGGAEADLTTAEATESAWSEVLRLARPHHG